MKKIFSILLLFACSFAHSQIGQFSPIWTYTGSNIQYTNGATLTSSLGVGALPTSSLSSFQLVKGTGSLNIGSSDGSGVTMWGNVTPSASNYLIYSNGASSIMNGTTTARLSVGGNEKVYCTSSGVKINSSSTPNSALDVNGSIIASGTFSLGSANLTGGNTGTVAVLSDAVFCTQSSTKPYDPTDGLTIYFANSGYLGLTTNATNNRIYVPKNCTLIGYDITGYTDGSSGTAETSTISIRIDNTTDVTLNSSITYSATYQQWHSMALSTDINAGSYFNLKWVTPTWVTNPTSVVNSVVLWFKLR